MEILHFSNQYEHVLFLQHVNGIRCFSHSVSFSGPIMVQVEGVRQSSFRALLAMLRNVFGVEQLCN